MSAAICGNRVTVAYRDEWEALACCPGSLSGAFFPDEHDTRYGYGFMSFTSVDAAVAARLGLGL